MEKETSPPLIVVHPSSFYDFNFSAQLGIEKWTNKSLQNNQVVITLVDNEALKLRGVEDLKSLPDFNWQKNYQEYFPSIDKTQILPSDQGENTILLNSKSFILVGGYMNACWSKALVDLIVHNLEDELTLIAPLDGIYGDLNEEKSFQELATEEQVFKYQIFFNGISKQVFEELHLWPRFEIELRDEVLYVRIVRPPSKATHSPYF